MNHVRDKLVSRSISRKMKDTEYSNRLVSNGMKRIASIITGILSVLVLTAPVSASHFWQIKMATPATLINSRNFNIEYTTLSVENTDDITVEAFQNGTSIGTQTTIKDFGDSGAFNVTVPADGTYQYHIEATSSIDGSKTTETKTVTVDTAAPAAVIYQGKVRNGNQYTLTFTAPADSDVTEIRIYSSTSSSFTANAATQIGVVTIAPGETKTFTYTAASDAERFHAVQAFDSAGNFSSLRNDPGATVVQGPVTTGTATTTTGGGGGAAGTPSGGAVAGENTEDNSQVGDEAATTENEDNGEVLGAEDKKPVSNRWLTLILLVLAALAFAYYWFYQRQGKSLFNRGQDK